MSTPTLEDELHVTHFCRRLLGMGNAVFQPTARRPDSDWRSEIDDQLISSKDVGMNCDFTANAETTEELLWRLLGTHGLDSIPVELMPMVPAAIRDE